MTLGRLKRPDEMSVGEWLVYESRHGEKTGQIPRWGDPDAPPSAEELAAAGWERPVEKREWAKPGPSAAEQIEIPAGVLRREIRALEQESIYVRQGGKTSGETSAIGYLGRLQAKMAKLQGELAAIETSDAAA